MGHSEVDVGLNIYSESRWDERVNAVSSAVTEKNAGKRWKTEF
jgi:hypothetical protein